MRVGNTIDVTGCASVDEGGQLSIADTTHLARFLEGTLADPLPSVLTHDLAADVCSVRLDGTQASAATLPPRCL